jgi:hypothetical protein
MKNTLGPLGVKCFKHTYKHYLYMYKYESFVKASMQINHHFKAISNWPKKKEALLLTYCTAQNLEH